MSSYTALMHAQHEGYYSPNTGSGNDYKRDRYLFQGVFRVENHGDAEIDLINSRDNTQARTKVPGRIIESGKTAIVNYLVRKSNSRASIDAGQAKLAADAIERYVQSHFNTELHHSEDLDVIVTDDYLEHHGILGMKWGVRRYQNADGSLTAEGRKHYNVKTINSTRMELAGAESDREKRTILTKATNKATGDQVKGIVAGTGSMVAGSLAKQAVARAAAGTLVRNLVYDSLTGTSSLITSVIPAAVPAWAAALTTPVGQIALAAVGTAGAAKAFYGAYKSLKLNELAAEFDVSTNVTRSINQPRSVNQAIEDGMKERESRQQSSTRGTHSYTPEQQREKLQTAKNNDRYDLDFLEFMQNTKISYDDNKAAMDKAYKEYLKDPEAFATDPDFYKKYPYA